MSDIVDISNANHSSSVVAGSLAIVDSVLQLSPSAHRHSKGRQIVSMTRRAEVMPVLLDLTAIIASYDYYCPSVGNSDVAKVRPALTNSKYYSVI